MTEVQDRDLHVAEAKMFGGLTPESVKLAFPDWTMHLANQPERQKQLAGLAAQDAMAIWRQMTGLPVEPLVPAHDDHRFTYLAGSPERSP